MNLIKKRYALIILMLIILPFKVIGQSTFTISDIPEEIVIKLVCHKNYDKFKGKVYVYFKNDSIPIIEDSFSDDDEALSIYPDTSEVTISLNEQRTVWFKDVNFDNIDDIMIVNKRGSFGYKLSYYIKKENTYKFDNLITEAYNWYDKEIDFEKQIVHGSGMPSPSYGEGGTYKFKNGIIYYYSKGKYEVIGNEFIEYRNRIEYENGEIIKNEDITVLGVNQDGVKVIISFMLEKNEQKVYFIEQNKNLHFVLEEDKKVVYFYPNKYPYNSSFFSNDLENEISFAFDNSTFSVKYDISNDLIKNIKLRIKKIDLNNKSDEIEYNAEMSTLKGNPSDIFKYQNVITKQSD